MIAEKAVATKRETIIPVQDDPYLFWKKTVPKLPRPEQVKHQKLEMIIQEMITIMYYAQLRQYGMPPTIISKLITYLIEEHNYKQEELYYDYLEKIPWLKLDILAEAKKRQMDMKVKIEKNRKHIETLRTIITEQETSRWLLEGMSPYYHFLKQAQKQGQNFTKHNLTKEGLYQLSIIEYITDGEIGTIFNLSVEQIRYRRNKYDMSQILMRKRFDFPEISVFNLQNRNIDTTILSKQKILNLLYLDAVRFAEERNWRQDTIEKYYQQNSQRLLNESNLPDLDLTDLEIEYDVFNSPDLPQSNSQKSLKKDNNGQKRNQRQTSESKIQAGKLGEKIAYDYERKRLKENGLEELADQVEWITQTEEEDITLDGLGYDIISYNLKKEKIYIEVKCKSNQHNKNNAFYISPKEIKLMTGNIKGIDEAHCFIYYVYDIDPENCQANIHIIDSKMFKNYELTPTSYLATLKKQ